MWKEYSANFIRKNKTSSVSIMVAAFICSLFLSLLCCLAFNFWTYEMERIILEEGDWQGRITGAIDENDLMVIENFANVENVLINETLSEEERVVADIYFQDIRTIYQDMPLITETLGLEEEAASYHELLLSAYMIYDPQDPNPPLLLAFYLVILVLVSTSLILIIHNSFAISMNARIHQFGIFSSIGAAPRQIFTCLMQEATALCAIPILFGSLLGIAFSFGTIQAINLFAEGMAGRQEAVFSYHPLVFISTILVSVFTVFISAWLPARKLSKITPLQAIRDMEELSPKKKKSYRILSVMFGIEGELAGTALKAQRKAFRTSTLSLTFSFLGFTVMLCFFTLTGISTNHTYFERYQNSWDIMVTLKDTQIEDWEKGKEIRNLKGVWSSVAYQKATAICSVPETEISDELRELGGLKAAAKNSTTIQEGVCFVKAPVVIMDDEGFLEYCEQIGVMPKTSGSIILNRIWDSINSNFRYKEYIPFLKEDQDTITLQNTEQIEDTAEIPVLAYTQEPPVLREEYDNYAFVQFMPLSLWKQISEKIGNTQEDTYIRILGEDGVTLDELNELQAEILQMIPNQDNVEIENRIQEKITDENIRKGSMMIIGAFCCLLAIIGIANVFSNTLGFLRQRKREFARYESVGMSPKGMKKMFCIEALIIAGRPLLITLPLTAAAVAFMITASYLDPMEFLAEAPFIPMLIFISAIFGFVGLAYYIGGKRMMTSSLIDALGNENIV